MKMNKKLFKKLDFSQTITTKPPSPPTTSQSDQKPGPKQGKLIKKVRRCYSGPLFFFSFFFSVPNSHTAQIRIYLLIFPKNNNKFFCFLNNFLLFFFQHKKKNLINFFCFFFKFLTIHFFFLFL